MDQSSSAGNSPLADGEKADLTSRNDLTDDEPTGKKSQPQPGRNQGQQTTPRKAPGPQQQAPPPAPQQQPQWRPLNQSPQNNPPPLPNQQHRFASKPRLQMAQSPGQNVQQAPQGGQQGQGAWPTATFYPRATRFPQATTINLNNGQGMPQQMGVQGYGQQGSQMALGNPGQYGGPRPMGMMPGGMGGMGMGQGLEQLSKTNLYIRGLPPQTSDRDLMGMCSVYGTINSTKAIVDKQTNQCKGYGFVDFENPQAADRALKELTARGMLVQMAKVRSQQEQLQDADPTNLYLANLSPYMTETDLEAMLQPYGRVVSTRVLRDNSHKSRGVGFARMESKDICDKVIEHLNGKLIAGSNEPLVVKFADSGNRRRLQNRDRQGGWNRMDQHMGMGGYEHMGGGQNGLAGSMLSTIRYQVPQTAALAGYQPQWQAQYTILPQQMTQMMQGVDGQQAGYSMAQMNQLAQQMNQLGLSSPYNASPYSNYGYNPAGMYQAGMAALGGGPGGQGDEGGPGVGVALEGAHSGVNSVMAQQAPNMAVYTNYQQK